MKYDVIVIGAGLGGLTAGAKLAKEGKKVLLIEQHNIPGGCATTYKRKDYLFEVGLHEMDGLHKRDMKTRIFRDLGVFDEVEFLKVPDFYRFTYKNYNITISHNPQDAKDELLKFFPEEEAGIDAYFNYILNIREILKKGEQAEQKNVGDFLDSIIKNKDLKLALLGNLGYFHDNPYTLSLSYYAIAQGSYYAGGGNFIKGGSQKLSDYLANYISEKNGQVVYKHTVVEILFENNKAIGVSYKKNNSSEIMQAHAEIIISNAAIPLLAEKLLPPKQSEIIKQEIKKREIGASLLTIYLGFKKPVKELGYNSYSTFVFDDSVEGIADVYKNNKGNFEKRSYTFIDYSQVDSALAPKGKSVGAICCIDYIDDWKDLSKEEYKKKKEEVAQIFLAKLEKLVPGINNIIDYYELGTSKTVERYTLNPNGAVYGFAQTPERMELSPITQFENLYYASAWTKIGGGFSGAIFNGYLTAIDIIRSRK